MTSTAPTPFDQRPLPTMSQARVQPDRLLARIGREPVRSSIKTRSNVKTRVARTALRQLLGRIDVDRLTVVDTDRTAITYGQSDSHGGSRGTARLQAELQVLDDRAWTAVAGEGSIGLGRGYIEGWWTSDELVPLLQVIIRNLRGLDELRNRWERTAGGATSHIRRHLPRPDRAANREDIASHYDLGNDFFALFLDETMTYSAAVFGQPGVDLAAASLAKYDRLLDKLGITPATTLLEIGTGWGGMAIRAAQTTGCPVTTTTISAQQRAEALDRVARAGLSQQVTVLNCDWRDLEGRYDRLVSIEMIEAVDWRHYGRFFAALERHLAPNGLVGIQAICVPDRRYERAKKTEDFIRRFVFPGGNLASVGSVTAAAARSSRLQVIDVEDLSAHYAETLAQWRARFDDRLDDIRALGLDERFCRLWRFYLAYCEAGFRERHCTVNQFILAGPDWRPDGLALRPH